MIIFQKMAELDKLKREKKEKLQKMNDAKWKYSLQEKEKKFCDTAKEELLKYMKKTVEKKSK